MDKDQFRNLAQSGDFIPGIYNYCDRWCEKCPLTSKCLTYATSEEDSDPESKDITNAAFWNKIGEMFKITMEMIREDADRLGIDLTISEKESKEFESHRKAIKSTAEKEICAQQSKQYIEITKKWFENSESIFKDKGIQLEGDFSMGIPGSDPEQELNMLSDSTDVVRWYQHQIYVKIMRALQGALEDRFDKEDLDEFPNDSDGSAKVALIGIDRSIGAWGYLMENLPGNSDDILDMLVVLEQLRKNVEKKFPQARSFVRVGFDDVKQK